MLNLTRLRVFQRVASLGSFSAAALALDYTQSTVSEQVGRLEDELGLTLLERATRPVRPTEAARVLLRQVELILGQEAAARPGGRRRAPSGRVLLGLDDLHAARHRRIRH